MTAAYHAANVLSIVVFLYFGLTALFAGGMRADFERFGLGRARLLIGGLEVLGALGLIVGYLLPALVLVSATGLALLMAAGVVTRVRVRDALVESVPAGALMIVNLFIALSAAHSFAAR